MTLHQRHPTLHLETHAERVAAKVPARGGLYRRFGKRALDLVLIATFAVPVLLIVGLLAVAVRRDGSPAFYLQERVGLNGERFFIWKLRTMVDKADERLAAYLADNPAAQAEWDHHQKLRDDPRVTRVGRILRKTSLDELPQLWNVIRGDMSLVGPRPMMVEQRDLYPGQEYYAMRPGITGYWQTSDRHQSSFADRAHHDTAYYNDMSLRTDFSVLFKSVSVVLRGTGC